MQAQARKWDRERVFNVLRKFWDIEEWEDESYDERNLEIPANFERPYIEYDHSANKIYIEFPDDNEELPNPDSSKFYPDLEMEIRGPEDIDKLREYIDDETVESIKRRCGTNLDCIIDAAYDAISDELEKQLEEEIRKIENAKPEYKNFCNVTIVKRQGVYEETRIDGTSEYAAYLPSTVYIIDLNKVPDERTLECIIEKILED